MPKHDALTSEPSLPGFIDWLRSKDPNEHYEWPNSSICACGQYSRDVLKQETWMGSGRSTWNQLNRLARGETRPSDAYCEADPKDWTFGKLLARCEKELEKV